ncbi:MAG: hypothetical protein ACRCWW_16000 [Scandinavium sp.]|uniref:hypothetical protein n=1 Tax=Scandinavium sp. TaxID=2830653 RepID=UPI003F2DE300
MKKIAGAVRRIKRWVTQPEDQDLQECRSLRRWSARTACCPSKKAWKSVLPE